MTTSNNESNQIHFGNFGEYQFKHKINFQSYDEAEQQRNQTGFLRVFGIKQNPYLNYKNQNQNPSWAGLFNARLKASASSNGVPSVNIDPNQKQSTNILKSPLNQVSLAEQKLYDVQNQFKVKSHNYQWYPRGLINRGNMCFMNSILQPLLYCYPLYLLLEDIARQVPHSFNSKTPLVDSLIMFIQEYQRIDPTEVISASDLVFNNQSFLPEYVYDALIADKRFGHIKGRQEDAEEFLGFLIDGIHEELLTNIDKMREVIEFSSPSSTESEGWVEVGTGNKQANKRNVSQTETPITKIFCGQLRSILKAPGVKDSITIEPFHALQLDITPDNVINIDQALLNLTRPESLEGYMTPTGKSVTATKQLFIEKLPPVLILHLKRFIFENGETQKVRKSISYGSTLRITPPSFSPPQRPTQAIPYSLQAVVYHHGRTATDGHYTCSVRSHYGPKNSEVWLHFDDTLVSTVSIDQVLQSSGDRNEYILFYIRSSLLSEFQQQEQKNKS